MQPMVLVSATVEGLPLEVEAAPLAICATADTTDAEVTLTGGPTEVVDAPLATCESVEDVGATPASNVPAPSVHNEADCLGSHERRLRRFISEVKRKIKTSLVPKPPRRMKVVAPISMGESPAPSPQEKSTDRKPAYGKDCVVQESQADDHATLRWGSSTRRVIRACQEDDR